MTWVRADRTAPAAYDGVAERDWDAVVDVNWQPDLVRSALRALQDRARHWVYVSSGSVYADDSAPGAAEEATLLPAHEGTGPVGVEDYGAAKVACEQACLSTLGPERVLAARAGLIGGYGDRSDRLGYWPARVARAGDGDPVLVPPREAPVQVIDVEDLAVWLVVAAEQRHRRGVQRGRGRHDGRRGPGGIGGGRGTLTALRGDRRRVARRPGRGAVDG